MQRADECRDLFDYKRAIMTAKGQVLQELAARGAVVLDIVPSCVASVVDVAGEIFQEADELREAAVFPDSYDASGLVEIRNRAIGILALISISYEITGALRAEDAPAGLHSLPVAEVLDALRFPPAKGKPRAR